MATKRQAPDDTTSQQSFRKRQKSSYSNKPPNLGKKSFKKAHPVNDLKSQIRNLRRLLEHSEDLPAGVRIEKERALQTARNELDQAQKAKNRSEIIGRWHKVRFFDRQKAERRLKKARKEVAKAEEEGGLDGDVGVKKDEARDLEVDVNYAIYFPLERDYVPLFPTRRKQGEEDGPSEVEGKRQGDAEMWEMVKKCMEEGTLQDLREGRLEAAGVEEGAEVAEQPHKVKNKELKKSQRTPKRADDSRYKPQQAEEARDEESGDDGKAFFE